MRVVSARRNTVRNGPALSRDRCWSLHTGSTGELYVPVTSFGGLGELAATSFKRKKMCPPAFIQGPAVCCMQGDQVPRVTLTPGRQAVGLPDVSMGLRGAYPRALHSLGRGEACSRRSLASTVRNFLASSSRLLVIGELDFIDDSVPTHVGAARPLLKQALLRERFDY